MPCDALTHRRVAPLMLLFVTCGADTSPDVTSDLTTGTETTAAPAPSTSTQEPAPTTSDTQLPGTSDTTTAAATSTAADPSTTDGPAAESTTTAATTGDDPPADPCADQDQPPPAVDPPGAINDDPAFIQVYVNNVENLELAGEQCSGDWTDLIYYMHSITPSPDLFLVQQVSDSAQLDLLIARMDTELAGVFAGVIADDDPWTQQSPCGKDKARQTNAIIYRKGRFDAVGDKHVWQSWANKDDECVRNSQARTRNVMMKLHDKIADRDVTVAAIHWSTAQGAGDDPACAKMNALETDEKLHKKGFEADLRIFGGDFNETDRNIDGNPRAWFAAVNGDGGGSLNYRDPIYHTCQGEKSLADCLDDNWTIGGDNRIDMVFAQDGEGCRARTRRAHTITFNEAEAAAEDQTGESDPTLDYSDHRSVRAELYY